MPFIAIALIRALREFPQRNAHFDAERGVLQRYRDVHLGIATQTPDGLKVPVLRQANGRSLWDLADGIARVSAAARDKTAKPAELSGSTITVTSLGRLGGIVSTPVINAPEVSIIGVNKAVKRPMVVDDAIQVRFDDESVVFFRSPVRGRLRCGIVDSTHPPYAGESGYSVHRRAMIPSML